MKKTIKLQGLGEQNRNKLSVEQKAQETQCTDAT